MATPKVKTSQLRVRLTEEPKSRSWPTWPESPAEGPDRSAASHSLEEQHLSLLQSATRQTCLIPRGRPHLPRPHRMAATSSYAGGCGAPQILRWAPRRGRPWWTSLWRRDAGYLWPNKKRTCLHWRRHSNRSMQRSTPSASAGRSGGRTAHPTRLGTWFTPRHTLLGMQRCTDEGGWTP